MFLDKNKNGVGKTKSVLLNFKISMISKILAITGDSFSVVFLYYIIGE